MRKSTVAFLLSILILSCTAEEKTLASKNVAVTKNTTVAEILSDEDMKAFSRLLFPVDMPLDSSLTLSEISSPSVYVWYSNIKAEKTVEVVSSLKKRAANGETVFYPIYSEDERRSDKSKNDAGLFFFKGEKDAPFAICNAGGGFYYVGAMHDSFPVALELSKKGCNAFALIYRPNYAYADLARAMCFVIDNAQTLEVAQNGYSLWGGSAGARMAAALGNAENIRNIAGRNLPNASAVVMQYTGYSSVSKFDAPTFAVCGTRDGIANWKTMKSRIERLNSIGIQSDFRSYEGLSHGFGLGTGTVAEGWVDEAFSFWMRQIHSEE